MGDISNMYDDSDACYETIANINYQVHHNIKVILEKGSNDYLIKASEKSQNSLVQNIRMYYNNRGYLSDKQRYILAKYIANNI